MNDDSSAPARARAQPRRLALRLGQQPAPWEERCLAAALELGFAVGAVLAPASRSGLDPAVPCIADEAPDAAASLRAFGVDLLVDLSLRSPRLDPGLETWQLRFGPEARPGPPGTTELERGERFVLARLVSIEDERQGRILVEGRIKTVPYSLATTRDRVLAVVARWPARALALLRAGLLERATCPRCSLEPSPARPPGRSALVQLRGAFRRLAAWAIEEEWRLGLIEAPVAALLQNGPVPPITWLPAPARGWIADPVGVRADTVFVEAFDPVARRGFIARTRLDSDARLEPVLRLPHHLSWPFLVEDEGELFLLPEMSAAGRVQLFRAAPFPDRFVPDTVLLDGFAGVDPTVHRHCGLWYLFVTDRHDQDETRLHLFVAERLRGPWRRHPMSPVVDDLGSARPAGPLFEHEGRLFRPAQDCTRTYGGALVIHRVEALTPELYHEVPVARLEPDPSSPCPHGLHSLVAAGCRTIVDGKRERRSLAALLASLRGLLADRLAR